MSTKKKLILFYDQSTDLYLKCYDPFLAIETDNLINIEVKGTMITISKSGNTIIGGKIVMNGNSCDMTLLKSDGTDSIFLVPNIKSDGTIDNTNSSQIAIIDYDKNNRTKMEISMFYNSIK
jgi:hypothetical protein